MRRGLRRRTLYPSVAGDGEPKISPLWHYMRSMAHVPPPARNRGADALPPREITEQDLEPLRQDMQWRPSAILEWFGPRRDESEHLGRLLVACAVIQGPHRLHEMTERLRAMISAYLPRVKLMRGDEVLASRRPELDRIVKELTTGAMELVQTRARAANDMDGAPANPDGLRMVDLLILVSQIQAVAQAHETVQRRNVAGLDFGMAMARQAPDMRVAEDWLDRLMGNADLNGILLYWPPAYGRVVVVYEDGRLAYDPGREIAETHQ